MQTTDAAKSGTPMTEDSHRRRLDEERIARAAEQVRGLQAGHQLGSHRPLLLRAAYTATRR